MIYRKRVTDDLYHQHYFYVTTLAHYLTGDTDQANADLERFNPDTELYPFYTGRFEYLDGLVNHDRDRPIEGIEGMLTHHRESTDTYEAGDDFISIDATVAIILGRGAGFDISVEEFDEELQEFLPEQLIEE